MNSKTGLVSSGWRGLTISAGSGGKSRTGPSFSPMPLIIRALRGDADRHIGTRRPRRLKQARIVERKIVGAGEEPQRRGGIGRAAADPGRHRQSLDQGERAEAQAFDPVGQLPRRLDDEVFFRIARGGRRRTADLKPQGFARRQALTGRRCAKKRRDFELVVAVGTAPDDMQRQIDFGGGAIGEMLGQGGIGSRS